MRWPGLPALLACTLLMSGCDGSNGSNEGPRPQDSSSGDGRSVSGWVEADETWEGEILLSGDVFVAPGATLTVQPGTVVRMPASGDTEDRPIEFIEEGDEPGERTSIAIVIMGTLDSRGTSDQPILFTSDSQAPSNLDWHGIMIEGDGSVLLDRATIEHSMFGLQLVSPTLSLSVSNSTFQDIRVCAICAAGPRLLGQEVVISDNRFVGCEREAIDTYADQRIVVRRNVFSENHVAIMSVGSTITIEDNLFVGNDRGIGVVADGSPTIEGNHFEDNWGAAIFVTEGSPTIKNNNFVDNEFHIQLEAGTGRVIAESNWWGSSDRQAIEDAIFDHEDDPALGLVDFDPFTDGPYDLDVPAY
jgi:parallel beta-helix repeat protein